MFIPNPLNMKTINHKNENKLDNNVLNLEWMTHSQNNLYSKARKIKQYDRNMNYIKTWNSIKETQLYYKCTHIQECCAGIVPTSKNYIWRYV